MANRVFGPAPARPCRYSRTAFAIECPSAVLVPLPISSRITRLRAVTLLRIFASSSISTKKVLCPLARSSKAPTRVNIRSRTPTLAVPGRDKTSGLGHDADQRNRPHIGGLACHIGAGDDHHLGTGTGKLGIIRYKSPHRTLFNHRVAPVTDDDRISLVQLGTHVTPYLGNFGKGRGNIQDRNSPGQ